MASGKHDKSKAAQAPLADPFAFWPAFPELKGIDEIFQDKYRRDVNERLIHAQSIINSADTLKQALYSMLELCAENDMLKSLHSTEEQKIKQLSARLEKMLQIMRSLLKKISAFSLHTPEQNNGA